MLIVLKIPSNPKTVLVVRLFITKLLAFPEFVDILIVEILVAINKLVLSKVVLRIGGSAVVIDPEIPVNPDPSPTNLAVIVPADIVEKKP